MVLVTGSNGLLGTKLVAKLAGAGEKVRCLDAEKPAGLPAGVEFIEGDILDERVLARACGGADSIIHLMDVKSPRHVGRRRMRKINIRGTRLLLRSAHAAGVKKMIFLSSYEVYGLRKKNRPGEATALKLLKPATRYGRDKLKAEKIFQEFVRDKKIAVTTFRPSLIVGPGTRNPIVLISLLMAMGMEEANRMYVADHGENRFQLLHPDDAAEALFLAHRAGVYGKVFNLGSDDVPTQIDQIVQVKEKAGLDAAIMHISSSKAKLRSFFLRPFKIDYLNKGHVIYLLSDLILDCQAAKSELGWQPGHGNVDIILETIEWYRKEKL